MRVQVTDLETGEESTAEVGPGNYVLICTDPCHVANKTLYPATHLLTIKGYGPQPFEKEKAS